jgi:hypothetical protein
MGMVTIQVALAMMPWSGFLEIGLFIAMPTIGFCPLCWIFSTE